MLAIIDTETSGLSPDRGARILQLAAVRIAPGGVLGSVVDGTIFSSYVCPADWDEKNLIPSYVHAEKVHGIEAGRVKHFPPEAEVRAALSRWCAEHGVTHFSAFNVSFDRAFMDHHRFVPDGVAWVECVMKAANKKHGVKGSLSAFCARHSINFESSRAHSAVYDALKAAELAVALAAQ